MAHYFLRPPSFPQFLYTGYLGLIISGYFFFNGDIYLSIGLLTVSLILILSRVWLRLDVSEPAITMLFAFIPYKKTNIGRIEKVFITERAMSQTLNSRGSSTTITYQQYNIYIRATGENYLLKSGRKKPIAEKAAKLAQAANVPLEDYTT